MIELHETTDRIVRHTLVTLMRQVPWGPSRDALLEDAERFRTEAAAATLRVNDIVLNEIFTFNVRSTADEAVLLETRERERRFRAMSDQLGWKRELYALAAAGRYPRPGDLTVENFAESIVEDIRLFQANGYSTATSAMRDVSAAVSSYLQAEGIALEAVILPPTIDELIDAGAERPGHVDQERWDRAVRDYNHRMTLDNTPSDFINGGSDYDDHSLYRHDDEAEEVFGDEHDTAIGIAMR